MRVVLHFLLLTACAAKEPSPLGEGTTDTGTADTGTADTGTADTGTVPSLHSSGAPVDIVLRSNPPCLAPEARDSAPFDINVTAGGWSNQYVPWTDPTAGRGWGIAVEDFNHDGELDIFLPNYGADELFLSDGLGGLQRSESAIPASARDDRDVDTTGVAATDIDGDGDIDLYLSNRGPDRLLRNDGHGQFEDISVFSGIGSEDLDSIGAAWGHLDDDGLPDLFVATYFMGIFPYEDLADGHLAAGDPNKLYRNLGDGRFEDISHTLPDAASATFAFSAGWHDVDLDGRADLIIVNDLGPIVAPNFVLRNTGGALEDWSSLTALDVSIYGMGMGVGDINGDTKPDFLFSSWDDLISMESDPEGDWFENSLGRGLTSNWVEQHVGWGVELMDLDNDGKLDVSVPFGAHVMDPTEASYFDQSYGLVNPDAQKNMVFRASDSGFESVAAEWGLDIADQSRAVLSADLNGDGWLDLVGRSLDSPAQIHMARCGTAKSLSLRLHDRSPNTHGLGVTVRASTVDGVQVRTMNAGSTGIASSGPHVLHFGLGTASRVDLSIDWLDGSQTHITNASSDQHMDITRL